MPKIIIDKNTAIACQDKKDFKIMTFGFTQDGSEIRSGQIIGKFDTTKRLKELAASGEEVEAELTYNDNYKNYRVKLANSNSGNRNNFSRNGFQPQASRYQTIAYNDFNATMKRLFADHLRNVLDVLESEKQNGTAIDVSDDAILECVQKIAVTHLMAMQLNSKLPYVVETDNPTSEPTAFEIASRVLQKLVDSKASREQFEEFQRNVQASTRLLPEQQQKLQLAATRELNNLKE